MPNGVSCAYFAARNLVYGTKENNVFKDGIAAAQTTRAVDFVAKNRLVNVKIPGKGLFSRLAAKAKRVLYPLIILSGIYNTARSNDKVRTGISQASAITTMFAFETAIEKCLLSKLQKTFNASDSFNGNKYARVGWYLLKGSAFALASLSGYNTGAKVAENIIDRHRQKHLHNIQNLDDFESVSDIYNTNLFEDMNLQ